MAVWEDPSWETLPEEEHKSVWDETERNFWSNFRKTQQTEHSTAEQEYQNVTTELKNDLHSLAARKSQLAETQARLAREAAKVDEEMALVSNEFEEKSDRLSRADQDHRKSIQARLETRQNVIKTMRRFFREKRGEDPDAEDPEDLELDAIIASVSNGVDGGSVNRASSLGPDSSLNGTGMDGVEYQHEPLSAEKNGNAKADTIVDVVDAYGHVIGPVQRIEPWNQWVDAILDLPIQRPVKIRRGRRFNEAHLATIYERSEAKGVKWLSCLIQATGAIQTKRCQSCEKNQGAFDDCVIVGGDLFQKCGNCEWNRQGCHGASGDVIDFAGYRRRSRESRQLRQSQQAREYQEPPREALRELQPAPEPRPSPLRAPIPPPIPTPAAPFPPGSERQPVTPVPPRQPVPTSRPTQADDVHPSTEVDTSMKDMPLAHEARVMHEPEQMPTPQEYRVTPGFTPANTRSRPPSADRPTPTSIPIEPSPQPTEIESEEPLEEITRENLVLRHNGQVYTYPECVAGVPLEKIDENHPYWEPNWQNVRILIEPQLAKWREKHQAAIDAGPKLEKGGSSKYQIGRQVNRGVKILEFLEEGEISPYQLLSKFYIQSGKGGICSYDTLFRLSESISELAKFKLDIKPVEWMRHRLWEIMQQEGSCFNLPRTIHDFYHDPKLTALRYKHGFKNIGRPSGMKAGRPSLGSPSATPKGSKPAVRKRKSMHTVGNSPNGVNPDQSPLATQMVLPPESPFSTHLQKRPKYLDPIPGPIHDEFHTDDHSDADSWSGAQLSKSDWRLYQVKTRLYTSSPSVTQYWTWLEHEQCFEHQVLKDINPVSWGLHKDPIDFHVNLDEVAEVVWNIEALKVHVVMVKEGTAISKLDGQPRGDVMAAFKRERTMRRFLAFCRQNRLRMLRESPEELDRRWQSLKSEQLPDENENPVKKGKD